MTMFCPKEAWLGIYPLGRGRGHIIGDGPYMCVCVVISHVGTPPALLTIEGGLCHGL